MWQQHYSRPYPMLSTFHITNATAARCCTITIWGEKNHSILMPHDLSKKSLSRMYNVAISWYFHFCCKIWTIFGGNKTVTRLLQGTLMAMVQFLMLTEVNLLIMYWVLSLYDCCRIFVQLPHRSCAIVSKLQQYQCQMYKFEQRLHVFCAAHAFLLNTIF